VVTFWSQGFGEEFEQFAAQEKCVLWYNPLLKCFSQKARILIVIPINQINNLSCTYRTKKIATIS
jgi:hypothetical protein